MWGAAALAAGRAGAASAQNLPTVAAMMRAKPFAAAMPQAVAVLHR
jgi:hypothetical protein